MKVSWKYLEFIAFVLVSCLTSSQACHNRQQELQRQIRLSQPSASLLLWH